MATELATAYISLIPELKGAGKSIASQLGGVDVAPSGRKLGKSLSDGISSGIDSSGIKQLENAVAAASQKVGRAMASEKDATNQLKVAQQRLVEVRSRYADGSSQVMAAEARVESAQRKATSASERTKSAQVELKRAQEQLSSANQKVASSSDDASRGIESMGKTAGSIKGAISTLAKVAGPAIAALGFGSLVSEAAAATDATQKFKRTLDFAGLDTSQIDALAASTKEYADATVYDLSDIQNTTAQLAANGVANYDKLAEAAGNLNAVAGGNAETYKSVGMVMTQTAGMGRLTTENFNQLADAIPGASGAIQDALLEAGAYTGNFREAMEKGEISAEEFNSAILSLGFDEAAVNAARSTSTFEGAMGNIQASAVSGMMGVLEKLQPSITGAMNALVPIVETAFAKIGDAVTWASENMDALAPIIAAVSGALAGMKIASVVSQMGGLSGIVSTLTGGVKGLFAVFSANPVGIVITAVAALAAALVGLHATNEGFRNQVNAFFAEVAAIFQPAILAIQQTIQQAMPLIQQAVSSALTTVQNVWNAVWPVLQAVLIPIMQRISSAIQTAMSVIQHVIGIVTAAISGDWDAVWSGIAELFSSIWEGIKSAAGEAIETVYNNVIGIKDRIIGFFGDAGSWLLDAGRKILEGLWDGICGALGWLGEQLGGIGDFIVEHKGPPSYDATMLVENGELIMGGLLRGMERGWGRVEGFVTSRNASIPSWNPSLAPAPAYAGASSRGNVYITIDGESMRRAPALANAVDELLDVIERYERT